MNESELKDLLGMVSDKVKRAFKVKGPTPPIKFVEEIPDVAAFGYDIKGEGNCHIAVNPSYREAEYSVMQWGLSEEAAHFCHYRINFSLFKEGIEESERTDRKNNNRLLEISNLSELVARIGGFYGGMVPPDHGGVIGVWEKIMETAKSKEEFDRKMKDPEYAQNISLISNRVWGAFLGDYIMNNMMAESGCLPSYELIRSLARVKTFREATESVRGYAPNSTGEIELVTERFFN